MALPNLGNPAAALTTSVFTTQNKLNRQNNSNSRDAAFDYSDAFYNRTVIAPAGVGQIGAFVFDYQGAAEVDMDNDITDHWVEDNVLVQDHIAVKPNMVLLSGFTAELSLQASLAARINDLIGTVENTLSQAPAYLGKYSPGTTSSMLKAITQVQNVVTQIEQAAARAGQIASFFQSGPALNKQQAAFAQLSALRDARILFTVFTPFQVFYNMAIMSLKAVQTEKTRVMSDFTVHMKQIKLIDDLAKTLNTNGGNSQFAAQPQTTNGITAGTPSPASNVLNAFKSPTAAFLGGVH